MLEFIRKRSASILVKALFALLILSFVSWGVGDFIRGRASSQSVAEVGGVDISPEEVSNAFLRQLNRMEQAFGTNIDREQAKAMGMVDAALGQLVNDTLWSLGAQSMGVTTSDDTIRQRIAADRAFMDQTGSFNQQQFEQTLLSNGYNEASYVALLRQRMARYQVANSVDAGVAAPKTMVEAVYNVLQEKRVAETFKVADSAMTGLPEPTEDDLAAFHQDNPAQFTAPEYREVTYVQLDAKELEDEVTITDEEIQDLYDQRQADFDRPETRKLSQIVVDSEEKAQEAYGKIQEGADFTTVAKNFAGMDDSAIEIGDVSKNMLLNELAEAAFALPQNGVSKPVKSPLGWHLLKVDSIAPAHKMPLEEAREQLHSDLAHEKSIDALFDLANKVEDALGGGATLEEAAQTFDLKLRHIDAIGQTGHDKDGNPVADLPPGNTFLNTAFDTAENTDSLLTEAGSDAYFVLRVDSVTPSAVRPLDEVRDQVASAWKQKQRADKAKETAEDMAKRLSDGSAEMADLAAELGAEVETTEAFTRGRAPAGSDLTPGLVRDLFAAQTGGAVSGRSGDGYVVAKLIDIQPANPGTDPTGVAAAKESLTDTLKGDIQAQFSAALRDEFPVEIHPSVLEQIF